MKNKITKAFIFWGIALLILAALIPIAGAENLYGSVIRIHVLAKSDQEEDQAVKLLVRDSLLEYARENLSLSQSREEAAREVEKRMDEMTLVAENTLRDAGFDQTVSLSLTRYLRIKARSSSRSAGSLFSKSFTSALNLRCASYPL